MTIAQQHTIDQQQPIGEWIEWLAGFGKTEDGGVTRLLYSESWKQAQLNLQQVMIHKGYEVRFDEVGNLFGRYSGTVDPASIILTGSHIDTVQNGGKFDGAYGVLASLIAVHQLYLQYGPPKKTMEVVSLAEEEGSRFPFTFWGSKWINGQCSLSDAHELVDSEGISLQRAMVEAGFGEPIPQAKSDELIDAFIELHIEQGIILENKQKDVGIVSDIVGQRRYTVQFSGESNHAGTTPMSMRKDALRLAAEFIMFISEQSEQLDSSLVATVGRISVSPNMPNVIAGGVECSLDIRHSDDSLLDKFESIINQFVQAAKQKQMEMELDCWLKIKPVHLSDTHVELAYKQAEALGLSYEKMVSGAGHDAQVFGATCPTTLLFVPSKNGISHSPEEWTDSKALEKGVELLKSQLYALAYE
ncbi:Zn-dependent hydrolase [Alkalicoccobacillus murimartini]|uniref:Allantoate deiminase n=1 Tax=Alkalicoccobacillus murimartini TaxID=171685 RepID=A0ABT9YI64_9BACI|nr:Zn-dependent hydrolase [Alkalicoccobacillus murimartini]MDQ0206729.1 allantoate deiminase [Alkalicoccobacillus murimartini]